MDSLITILVMTIIFWCLGLIAFLLGVLVAIPEGDSESETEYLKKRISILEEREHLRILEEYELAMMDPVSEQKKEKKAPQEPAESDDKKEIQTKWNLG